MENEKKPDLRTKPEAHNTQFIEAMATYHFIRDMVKGKKVLDAACGYGYGTDYLSKYASSVLGIDFSPEAISWAKKTYRADNIEFMLSDVKELGFHDESFDVVCIFEAIHFIIEFDRALEELKRVLKSGGLFLISTRRKFGAANRIDAAHVRMFTSQEFKTELSKTGLKVNELYSLDRPDEVYKLEGKLKEVRRLDPLGLRRFIPRKIISFMVFLLSKRSGMTPPQEMAYDNFRISKDADDSSSPGILAICRK